MSGKFGNNSMNYILCGGIQPAVFLFFHDKPISPTKKQIETCSCGQKLIPDVIETHKAMCVDRMVWCDLGCGARFSRRHLPPLSHRHHCFSRLFV